MSYFGFNPHLQNGKAFKRVRDIQDNIRKIIQHDNKIWPISDKLFLWPYALQQFKNTYNCLPDKVVLYKYDQGIIWSTSRTQYHREPRIFIPVIYTP